MTATATVLAAPLPAEVTLDDLLPENGGDGSTGFVVRGNAENARLDLVSPAGDVNGDGTRDFMVGSYDFAGDGRGTTYVIFGGAGVFLGELAEWESIPIWSDSNNDEAAIKANVESKAPIRSRPGSGNK